MSDQHEYIVQVADRETGKLSQLRLRSSDPDTARATAYEQGWLVESIRLVSPTDTSVPAEFNWVLKGGVALFAAGSVALLYAFSMDTTNGRVHNIGLLNDRTIIAAGGLALGMTGIMLAGLSVLGRAVAQSITSVHRS